MTELSGLAQLIDHTVLAPDTLASTVLRFCDQAIEHGFCSVCVNGVYAPLVAARLGRTAIRTCVVVGFPLGASSPAVKAAEAARAMDDGASEIDMVIGIGALKDGDVAQVHRDIAAVRAACRPAVLKVILETCLLTDAEKRLACHVAREEAADFVKTSTGFSSAGATMADVMLMAAEIGPGMGVKASGGIRTRAQAEAMIAAGAQRIGTSSGIAIVSGVACGDGY